MFPSTSSASARLPKTGTTWVAGGPIYRRAKRAFDLVASGLGLLFFAPVFALVALAIKLYDRGPVFFTQTRVGKGGREFKFYKFRSMCMDAEAKKAELLALCDDDVRFKMEHDPRITPPGRWIRRLSLDELPQLWNVFVGDMSVVGPRPPLPDEVALYGRRQRKRLDMEQGLTCIWQVEGRAIIPFEQQVELDLKYGRTRSFLGDMALILRTIPAVLSGRGAF